jgi:hypothetical protein
MARNLKHTPEGLMEAFAEHLHYELDMLFAVHYALEVTATILTAPVRYGLVEVFCIHARNLIEFFNQESETPGHARSDYMGAKHFCESGYLAWKEGRPDRRLVGKLSRHVSHLTYDRTKEISEKIGVEAREELIRILKKEISNFGSQLREPYRSKWRYGDLDSIEKSRLVMSAAKAVALIDTEW